MHALDVRSQVENVFLAIRPRLGTKSVRWFNEVAADTPPVLADLARFRQIMHHLLENAVNAV